MLELVLGAVGASATAAGIAFVRRAREYHGGWSDSDLEEINRRRQAGAASAWLAQSKARASHLENLGLHTEGAPEGYAYTLNTSGAWVLVKIPHHALNPPPYDGPRGR